MTSATHALFTALLDYAGLLPPAGLSMEGALAHYAACRGGPDAWILGRIVVPVGRLEELASALTTLSPDAFAAGPWRIAALAGADLAADVARIGDFHALHGESVVRVTALEARAAATPEIERAGALVPGKLDLVLELPLGGDLALLARAVKAAGAVAKLRAGGVRAEDIPSPDAVLAFLVACARERLAFKATAGLHHPVRGPHALTSEPDAERATLFGYLNVLTAAVALWHGGAPETAARILVEEDRAAFRLDETALAWRDLAFPAAQVAAARADFVTAIGSCSFREPVDEIREMAVALA
jgi:hypothetical protein